MSTDLEHRLRAAIITRESEVEQLRRTYARAQNAALWLGAIVGAETVIIAVLLVK